MVWRKKTPGRCDRELAEGRAALSRRSGEAVLRRQPAGLGWAAEKEPAIGRAEEKRVSSRESKSPKVGTDLACLKKKIAWQIMGRGERRE